MDVMRFVIDVALLMWAAWATWAYIRWKEIADDLRDEIEAADDELRDARSEIENLDGALVKLVRKNYELEKLATAQQNLNISLEAEIKKYRAKEKPMACKGKKTGKGKRGK